MNIKRIKELEALTNEFNSQIKSAFETYTIRNTEKEEMMNKTPKVSFGITKKKKIFSNTLFEESNPWIPNDGVGGFFGQFHPLTPKNDLNSWEILRVKNLIKRSYARQPEFLSQRDMRPSNSVGRLFDDQAKQNPNATALSNLGMTIIDKFIDANAKKERILRSKEQQLWEYRHSKPKVEYNPWKFSNHIKSEFSKRPVDIAYSFRVEKKKKYFLEEPFRIPKKEGDYFDSKVKGI